MISFKKEAEQRQKLMYMTPENWKPTRPLIYDNAFWCFNQVDLLAVF